MQKRRFNAQGEIIERHKSEKQCYVREKWLISEQAPPLNKAPGGGGSKATRVVHRRTKEEIEMDLVGTRVYAARALMRKGDKALLKYIGASNLEKLRQVAYG